MVMHGQNSFGKLTKKGYPENYAKKGDPETPIDRSEDEVLEEMPNTMKLSGVANVG
jgi:hypothetical protein